jgi:hypothetical protein
MFREQADQHVLLLNHQSHFSGTPTKRQVSKRQVSKRLVSKRPVSKRPVSKCQDYKT